MTILLAIWLALGLVLTAVIIASLGITALRDICSTWKSEGRADLPVRAPSTVPRGTLTHLIQPSRMEPRPFDV